MILSAYRSTVLFTESKAVENLMTLMRYGVVDKAFCPEKLCGDGKMGSMRNRQIQRKLW